MVGVPSVHGAHAESAPLYLEVWPMSPWHKSQFGGEEACDAINIPLK